MIIHSIPGKLEIIWLEEVKAILDKWTNYNITLSDFKEATLRKGLRHSANNDGRAYIVDSSEAIGVFSKEIQEFIETDIFPAFATNGIKYFITINSKKSAITEINVKVYSEKVKPAGITLVEMDSLDQAIDFLKQNK
jgi:hypothetical protein